VSKPLFSIQNGVCGYGDTAVVSSVNLSLHRGEFVILEGENGSGKSTLIKTVLGYLPSLGGDFSWHTPQTEVGYVPQDISLDLSAPASVMDVVLTSFPFGGKKCRAKAREALELVGLSDRVSHRFGTLSGGQRRRVLFARALAPKPACFILDEPTVNMDSETEAELGSLLHRLVTEENRAVIATSHVTEWVNHSRRCRIQEGLFYE
jgi:ABC-type Mn2+/Zn2+ transport system ATPase subunit